MNIYAHRGNSGFFPENTMYAFKKSLDLDICGIELDVQKTKDGILVVHHDETLGRVFDGKGYIKKLTFDQLVDSNLNNDELISRDDCKIPTLEEVLELIKPTNLTINIEIKMLDDDTIYQMETFYRGGIQNFINYYSNIKFKCVDIKYHSSTNQVKYMLFEQITS